MTQSLVINFNKFHQFHNKGENKNFNFNLIGKKKKILEIHFFKNDLFFCGL